jgi:hypothetical protein
LACLCSKLRFVVEPHYQDLNTIMMSKRAHALAADSPESLSFFTSS